MEGADDTRAGLHHWLLQAAREIREGADASPEDVASAGKIKIHVVARFENGATTWPRELDQLLDGYAAAARLHGGAKAIVGYALELWAASELPEAPVTGIPDAPALHQESGLSERTIDPPQTQVPKLPRK